MKNVKVLKDFQAACRRRTGRALSQKKDPHVQLISTSKKRGPMKSKRNDKKVTAMNYGPPENAHVANYRLALTRSPCSLSRDKWSEAERKSLEKGIKQQFQQMSFQMSVDRCSGSEGSFGGSFDLDAILKSIADFKMTPEQMNLFLPKVNWEQLASMSVPGRSGAECEMRWLNWENPLINHSEWTKMEEGSLVHFVQEKGHNSWIDIATLLRTNRTPFQCLMRFQRSLNTFILKKEWTPDEDAQLRNSVETFGESNWQLVASSLEGRTGTQCSNRWKKSLHPMRKRTGRFTLDEDKRLRVAVKLLGPKTWHRIAQFVPGRTQVQCRERWVNSLDPSLNWDEWTEEEDSRLEAEVEEYEYCWSVVAKRHVPPRTDNQCWRRWKVLFPHKVPLYQAYRKLKKLAIISNFVDREAERPALGATDFLSGIDSICVVEDQHSCGKQKKSRRKRKSKESVDVPKRVQRKKRSNEVRICSDEVPATSDAGPSCVDAILTRKKRVTKPRRRSTKNCKEPTQDPSVCPSPTSLMVTEGNCAEDIDAFRGNIMKENQTHKAPSGRGSPTKAGTMGRDGCELDNGGLMVTEGHGVEEIDALSGDIREEDLTSKVPFRRGRHPKADLMGRDGCKLKNQGVMDTEGKGFEECDALSGVIMKENQSRKGRPRRIRPCKAGIRGRDGCKQKNGVLADPSSTINKHPEHMQGHSLTYPDSSLAVMTNSGAGTAHGVVDATNIRRAANQCPRMNISPVVEKSDGIDAIPKKRKSLSLNKMGSKGMQDPLPTVPLNQDSSTAIVPDVTSIASSHSDSDFLNKGECSVHQKVRFKQLRTRKKSSAHQISEVVNDDMTLASFLRSRR